MTITADTTADFHQQIREGRRVASYSMISEWMSCRHKWFLKYGLGIGKPTSSYQMSLGTIVHEALAMVLMTEPGKELPDWREYVDAWAQDAFSLVPGDLISEDLSLRFENIGETAMQIVERTLDKIKELGWETANLNSDGTWNPAVEFELQADLPGTVFEYFASHVDWLAKAPDGKIWSVDFKTRTKFSSREYEQLNLQHSIYYHLGVSAGLLIDGTVTFEIKSEPPTKPKLNKNGTMSKVVANCDWETYKQALSEAGLDYLDYLDMKSKLSNSKRENLLFEYRNQDVTQNVWDRIVLPAVGEMDAALRGIDAGEFPEFIWRSLRAFNCQSCDVRNTCFAALSGYDPTPSLRGMLTTPAVDLALERGWLER